MADIILDEQMPFFRGKKENTPQSPPERRLEPEEMVKIDLINALADKKETHDKIGINGRLMAIITAGGKEFRIIDARDSKTNRDFYILDNTYSAHNENHLKGLKGVLKGSSVVIGREHHADRFAYPSTVSRNHFNVNYDDQGLFITNLSPTNPTSITAYVNEPILQPARHHIEDIRTELAEDRMRGQINFGEKDKTAPYGYYINHPIIGRDSSSVDGGVYLGGSAREAIVVDGKSEAVKKVYGELEQELRTIFQNNETLLPQTILLRVMQKVQNIMPYDVPKTEQISSEHYGDGLVGLSTFIKEKAGVCRHQGLLAAYIIERLIDNEFLAGRVGVERNTVKDMGGTHAWAVFKPSPEKEELIVVDPAQSFVGTKAQAERENRWPYRLSTDDDYQ